jgi:hypothetical protein
MVEIIHEIGWCGKPERAEGTDTPCYLPLTDLTFPGTTFGLVAGAHARETIAPEARISAPEPCDFLFSKREFRSMVSPRIASRRGHMGDGTGFAPIYGECVSGRGLIAPVVSMPAREGGMACTGTAFPENPCDLRESGVS